MGSLILKTKNNSLYGNLFAKIIDWIRNCQCFERIEISLVIIFVFLHAHKSIGPFLLLCTCSLPWDHFWHFHSQFFMRLHSYVLFSFVFSLIHILFSFRTHSSKTLFYGCEIIQNAPSKLNSGNKLRKLKVFLIFNLTAAVENIGLAVETLKFVKVS